MLSCAADLYSTAFCNDCESTSLIGELEYDVKKRQPFFVVAAAAAIVVITAGQSSAGAYRDAIAALQPDHWYHLDEDATEVGIGFGGGTAVDSGFAGTQIDGTYGGITAADDNYDPATGNAAQPGPPLPGFDPSNVSFDANNKASISLGPNAAWSNSVMSVATWFKVGNGFSGR